MKDVIYISVNNWFCGRDYPPLDCFKKWLGDDLNQTFRNDKWAKENKLCIYYGNIDMSQNYTISAPREWVEKNCPELLTKYSNFMNIPEKGEKVPYARFYGEFLEYTKENIGIHYDDSWFEDN